MKRWIRLKSGVTENEAWINTSFVVSSLLWRPNDLTAPLNQFEDGLISS